MKAGGEPALRIVFMGTPEFAVPTLVELIGRGYEVAAVYTRAPAAGGRGMAERRSPVHETAEKFGLPVLHPTSLNGDAAAEAFRGHAADVAVVMAYGLLLPKAILEAPEYGCLNLHASLLPRWRGAAPIARAIMAGDSETGVCVMRMDQGLDTGPVALAERVPIGPDTTAGELHDQLAVLGADLMARALAALERGVLEFKPQPAEGVTYAKKIEKGETQIDWSKPWKQVHDHIRGLSPHPGAWFEAGGTRIKVIRSTRGEGSGPAGAVLDDRLTVACGEGAVRLLELQRAGGKPMGVEEFLRGLPLAAGTRLG
jgi:methionyl-tRNA formyltransferase